MPNLWSLAGSVALGLLLAGPVAAVAVALLPSSWRSPAVPWLIAGCAVGLVIWLRHGRDRRP